MSERSSSGGSGAVRNWWQRTCSLEKGSPEVRAKLRRCHGRVDAAMIPQALMLGRMLAPDTGGDVNGERFGTVLDLARVLAHVKTDDAVMPMRAVGWKKFPTGSGDEERPTLSELRFKRLLQATDGEARADGFIRLLAIMDGKANVAEITNAFRGWGHPDGYMQKQWAFAYYNAANYAPDAATEHPSDETI